MKKKASARNLGKPSGPHKGHMSHEKDGNLGGIRRKKGPRRLNAK